MPQPDWELLEFMYGPGLLTARYRKPDGEIGFETLRVRPDDVPALVAELFKTMDQNIRPDVLAEVTAADAAVRAERWEAIGRTTRLT